MAVNNEDGEEGNGAEEAKQSSSRGPYHKPSRTQRCREIRKLLVEEGLSYDEVIRKLNLPERTFYRYLSQVFEHDRRLWADNVSDELNLNQFTICSERLQKQRKDILEQIANNPEADFRARVDAHHLAGEIAATLVKMRLEAPVLLAQRHRFPNTATIPLAAGNNNGIRLTFNRIHENGGRREGEIKGEDKEGGVN